MERIETKNYSSNHQFYSQFDYKTRGIVWITQEPINFSTPFLYEINYLLDNLFLKSLRDPDKAKKNKSNLLWAKCFGQDFFVSHLVQDPKNMLNSLNIHLNIAASRLANDEKIAYLIEPEINNRKESIKKVEWEIKKNLEKNNKTVKIFSLL
ncbi:hypothetical protein N9N67_01495 [Bacteriovoracaceae bacterium]|nr:hypothetical protein [Bacteriovoracaceae bacterium]